MAPAVITDDYYGVLELSQSATRELIVRSYRRLALKLHPDRNAKLDATQAFQLLQVAYETLSDEIKRRAYDLIYPSIARKSSSPQDGNTTRPAGSSAPHAGVPSEEAQIIALEKSKRERSTRWLATRVRYESSISLLQNGLMHLERDIAGLANKFAADVAAEAWKNSWTSWMLSSLYRQEKDSEEKEEARDRARTETRIEKDLKERRLDTKKAELKKQKDLLRTAKAEFDAANLYDDRRIRSIQARLQDRILKQRQEAERERAEKARAEQERAERAARAEEEWLMRAWQEHLQRQSADFDKRRAEQREAEQRRQEEARERLRKSFSGTTSGRYSYSFDDDSHAAPEPSCVHGGWWPKLHGRQACPQCGDVWLYLLECPGCDMKACPKCQAKVRPRKGRHPHRTKAKPSPEFTYYDWD